nr:FCD domain-containing protein [Caldilineaceae bacterium]
LTIFRRLDNLFVTGLLEAYWDAYEAVDLNTYADYRYLTAVWGYHEQIVKALGRGTVEEARQLHIAHMKLLDRRGASFEGEALPAGADLPDGTHS